MMTLRESQMADSELNRRVADQFRAARERVDATPGHKEEMEAREANRQRIREFYGQHLGDAFIDMWRA